MKVECIDPLDDVSWDQSVAEFPDAQVFHRSAWARVLRDTYRHVPHYLRFSDSEGIQAAVPLMEVSSRLTGRRAVCLPFADLTGPLLRHDSVRESVLSELKRLAQVRHWSWFELRGGGPPEPDAVSSATFHGHRICLPSDPEVFYRGLSGNVRRRIQRGAGAGLEIVKTTDLEATWEFYHLLAATRQRHGVPPQPRAFFSNLHAQLLSRGLGTIILARSAGRAVAGAVLLHSDRRAVYKFAASSPAAAAKFPGGNNLVLWEAIRFLIEKGVRELHLGRTSLHNDGLRRFKSGWGAIEEPIDYFRFSRRFRRWTSGTDRSRGAHNALFSRMPPGLNRLIGTFLYPHLD